MARWLDFSGDMADPQDAVSLHDAVLERFGTIDVLVNNASSAPQGSFETMSDKTFETMVNTNIRSVFLSYPVGLAEHVKAGQGSDRQYFIVGCR